MEFLNSTNLKILNRGNKPTFCSGVRLEVIYITLGSLRLLESFISWEVSSESNHSHILFILRGSVQVRLIRNPRGTNWSSFKGDLRDRLERSPEMNMKNELDLGLQLIWFSRPLSQLTRIIVLLYLLRQAGNLVSGLWD